MSQLFKVLESIQGATARFEILQYKPLANPKFDQQQQSGQRLKQIRIVLNNGKVITETGTLHFHKGQIEVEIPREEPSGMMKKISNSVLTNEFAFKPIYSGTGEIYLEPGFHHYVIHKLHNDEIVVDQGMFFCCESTIKVNVTMQKSFSATVIGGEGWFQTKLSGTGICVLKSPVPEDEILKLKLNNEQLQVDGSSALLWSSSLSYSLERSAKSLLGSLTGRKGYLQTFSGTGTVWLAPTEKFYRQK